MVWWSQDTCGIFIAKRLNLIIGERFDARAYIDGY